VINIADYIDDSGILLTENVIRAGVEKSRLYSFIEKNGLEKVAQGIYATPECWVDELYILHLRCAKGVVSHDEALYYYDIVDREPFQHTITIYTGYGVGRLKSYGVKVYTVKRELLEIGKTSVETSTGHIIPMYDLERTICDVVRSRSQMEVQDYQSAIRRYAKRKDKDLNKLMKYAKLFHVDKIIRGYMEVLI